MANKRGRMICQRKFIYDFFFFFYHASFAKLYDCTTGYKFRRIKRNNQTAVITGARESIIVTSWKSCNAYDFVALMQHSSIFKEKKNRINVFNFRYGPGQERNSLTIIKRTRYSDIKLYRYGKRKINRALQT